MQEIEVGLRSFAAFLSLVIAQGFRNTGELKYAELWEDSYRNELPDATGVSEFDRQQAEYECEVAELAELEELEELDLTAEVKSLDQANHELAMQVSNLTVSNAQLQETVAEVAAVAERAMGMLVLFEDFTQAVQRHRNQMPMSVIEALSAIELQMKLSTEGS